MRNLEIKTRNSKSNIISYKDNLSSVTTFLRHSEDRITIINGEQVQIDVYDNDVLIFSGHKQEFFELLKQPEL